MRVINHIYTDDSSLENFLKINVEALEGVGVLVQIFSGVVEADKFMSIAKSVKSVLKNASVIGTTTSGEIANGEMYDGKIVLSFSIFEKSVVHSNLYSFEKGFELEKIQNELISNDVKALIIFSDGLKSNAEVFLKQLHKKNKHIMIAGGRAGDNSQFHQSYVFNDEYYTENGCVIAALSGDDLLINTDYMLNWSVIGQEMLVTKSKGNILYELDNIPIIEVYRRYLGDDIVTNLPESCMPFPLITKKEDVLVARDPVGVCEKGGLVFAGNFEDGDIVRFSFGNIEDFTDNLKARFKRLNKNPAEAVYVYSCTARKALLKEKLLDELSVLESLAPTAGFFTYGEFFQSKKAAELLNVTTTFMMLSEKEDTGKKQFKERKVAEFDAVLKALTHLVKITTMELEHLSTHDILTGLYNRNEYLKVINNTIKSAKRYNERFGLILLDIDHFKLVNDNYGHSVGDKVLKELAKVLRQNVREADFVGRWGGEEFVIIANHAGVEELEKLVKKLQRHIEKMDVNPLKRISASFGLTVYIENDTDESMFKRVDNALYVAKQTGRDRYVIG